MDSKRRHAGFGFSAFMMCYALHVAIEKWNGAPSIAFSLAVSSFLVFFSFTMIHLMSRPT